MRAVWIFWQKDFSQKESFQQTCFTNMDLEGGISEQISFKKRRRTIVLIYFISVTIIKWYRYKLFKNKNSICNLKNETPDQILRHCNYHTVTVFFSFALKKKQKKDISYTYPVLYNVTARHIRNYSMLFPLMGLGYLCDNGKRTLTTLYKQ